ncbi:SoxR reducing system RseC family protein [Confluentibacter lentus]|uniref:SoxR reducing system RseC family protein n=1 Tax=Confluentibacter lentus TaxID=1699412 RepID=UPI000C28D442|nr:SoxR reducing system RseC family protein [Confluentibacter lentus]
MLSELTNKNTFVHYGIISKIVGDSITVNLEQNIHCESCHAKGTCGISDSETKKIEVTNPNDTFKTKERVCVVLKKTLGLKAILWAYIIPFTLMFATLIISSNILKELAAGILSLLVLLPYYLILYFFKNTFKSIFKISILKT